MVAFTAVWSRSAYWKLRSRIRKERPNIVHFHNTFPLVSPAGYYAARAEGVPVVQTLHNYRPFCLNAILYRGGRTCEECLGRLPWPGIRHGCYRNSHLLSAGVAVVGMTHSLLGTWRSAVDVYIVSTEFARRKAVVSGIPARKLVVKPNVVVLDDAGHDAAVSNEREELAIVVARLDARKGIRTILRAFTRARMRLKIVGTGDLSREVAATLRSGGMEHVELLGWLPHRDVLALMRTARLLIVGSEFFESFGNIIVEGFANGLPVLVSSIGGQAELVEHGRTGLHFVPGDPNDLAAKVEWAWTHPREMAEMGREARLEYELKYTAERNYKMLMEIYDMAIARARR